MSPQKLSRRKFMATSSAVVAGIAALSVQGESLRAQQPKPDQDPVVPPNPEKQLASIDTISLAGVPQQRFIGAEAERLADIPIALKEAEYSAFVHNSPSVLDSSAGIALPSIYKAISGRNQVRTAALAGDGLRYTNYALQTQVEGVWAEKDTATVIWTERVSFIIAGDPDPRAPQKTIETINHCTLLRREGVSWMVERDIRDFSAKPSISTPRIAPISQQILINSSSLDRSKRIPPSKLAQQMLESEGTGAISPNPSVISGQSAPNLVASPQDYSYTYLPSLIWSTGSYSRESASEYALAHGDAAVGDENGYHDYGEYGNCTNFLSQCLAAGQWYSVRGAYDSTNVWWYDGLWPWYASYTWTSAHYWWQFAMNSGRVEGNLSTVWDLWLGDVLQYSWYGPIGEGNNEMGHSAIVSFRGYNGNIYLAQHSDNYSMKPIADSLASAESVYPNFSCYAWRMKVLY